LNGAGAFAASALFLLGALRVSNGCPWQSPVARRRLPIPSVKSLWAYLVPQQWNFDYILAEAAFAKHSISNSNEEKMKTHSPEGHDNFANLMQMTLDSCTKAQRSLIDCELIATPVGQIEREAWALLRSNLKSCLLLLSVISISGREDVDLRFHACAIRGLTKGILQ
jgi:hypothetical protein